MTDTGRLRQTLIERMLDGEGMASRSERCSAFENAGLAEPLKSLVQKVATKATAVTDGDIAAALAFGLSEDQVFEIAACAAVGQSTRQHEAGVAALDLALREA